MSAEPVHTGACFCGEVQFELAGAPVAMGYCHCESCRRWSAGPVNAFTLWNPDAVRVTHGLMSLVSYDKTPNSRRQWCKECGGHVLTVHPALGVVDVYAATISRFAFVPAVHVHYQETVLRLRDGLPKMKELPAAMGGSGIELPE